MKINTVRINSTMTLEKMHEKCLNISLWCHNHGINRRTFYKTLKGKTGRRRDAHEAMRIIRLLDSEGLLVTNNAGT